MCLLLALATACNAGSSTGAGADAAAADGSLDATDHTAPPFDVVTFPDAVHDGFAPCTEPATLSPIPDAGSGCVFDVSALFAADSGHNPQHVNVRLLGCDGGPGLVYMLESAAECGVDPAIFPDNAKSPTRYELCPDTCALARSECDGDIEVLFGCDTASP